MEIGEEVETLTARLQEARRLLKAVEGCGIPGVDAHVGVAMAAVAQALYNLGREIEENPPPRE